MPKNPPRRKKIVIDSSCYIPYLNHPSQEILQPLTRLIFENVEHLNAVVLAKLKAEANQSAEAKRLDALKDLFHVHSRLLTPSFADWNLAGEVLVRLRKKFHLEGKGRSRIFNDVLIALSSRRIGAAVITRNSTDFIRIRACYGFELHLLEQG